jgi:hypothetical protein
LSDDVGGFLLGVPVDVSITHSQHKSMGLKTHFHRKSTLEELMQI